MNNQCQPLRSLSSVRMWIALLALVATAGAQEAIQDSSGTTLRLMHGGRFVQGTSGGERTLQKAFPLSTTGQFYGNAEDPAHVTWITKPFYLAETEVTVDQFAEFVTSAGYKTSAERQQTEMVGWEPTPPDKPLYQSYDFLRDAKFTWKNPGFPQKGNHPVVGVSWADAKAYCEWLSEKDGAHYRLPTEAEWEFACRAGTSTWFSFGDKAKGVVHQYGNLGNVELERHRKHAAERQWLLDFDNDPEDGYVFTAPVKSYEANAFALHDMHGNVWEWCEDLWLDTVYKDFEKPRYDQPNRTAVDPVNTNRPQTPANNFHTIRGGSWYNGDLICRSASRTYWDREDAACYIGFRIARDADANVSTTAREMYTAEQAAVAAVKAAGGKVYSSRGLDLEVRFEGESFDEAALINLQRLPDLERVRIAWRKRDGRLSQASINTVASLSTLKSLEIASDFDPTTIDLSPLNRLAQLEVLKFPRSSPLTDRELAMLNGLTSLVEFECFGTAGGLKDSGIAQLSGNRQLRTLHVYENEATGLFLEAFVGCPLTSLSSTAMYGHDGTLTDHHTVHLAKFPRLQQLQLDGQGGLTGSSLDVISGLSNLQRLHLDRCTGFADDDFAVLAGLQKLRSLNLTDTHAGDRAATAIASIPRIEDVRIVTDDLTDVGLQHLSQAFSIQELQLHCHRITDTGVVALGRINRLKRLTIQSKNITGSGLRSLVNLPELQDLTLLTPGLTDVAFEYLSRVKSLKKLRLAQRGIQPAAALTNDGLMKMEPAVWLTELWLPRNDTQMTEEKMNELKKRMPKTNVIVYTVDWTP
ncbi:MAG: SUMF1/EgtB/PvdO family nonheme iron enzyme [Planctomycetaceae bacterium]